jgi:4-amino-4-deoxy-L-arabinose transferase-like glycosyltransferase
MATLSGVTGMVRKLGSVGTWRAILTRPQRWEWEVPALILFVVAAYSWRSADVPLVGEETRRALIAREMAESGDWIVPRQQGEPRLTKPPVQYWAIALSTALFGQESLFAVRLPSVTAVGLTALVLYGYARIFLSRSGALVAGLAFLTTAEILHSGRFAQIDPLFMFF